MNWADDSWFSQGGLILVYDKLEHLLSAFVGMYLLSRFIKKRYAALICISASILWEVRDIFFADGFSWRDLTADLAGIIGGLLT